MKQISKLAQQIREYVNSNNLFELDFNNRLDEWYTLCVAMDILEDTCLALQHYENYGIGNKLDEKYLKLYGLLQAIFLQQDSINELYKIFRKCKLKHDSNSVWERIRNFRNLTIGHPIKQNTPNEIKRCFISRGDMVSDSLQLVVWNKNKEQLKGSSLNLKDLYKKYKLEAIKYLNDIIQCVVTHYTSACRHAWVPIPFNRGRLLFP